MSVPLSPRLSVIETEPSATYQPSSPNYEEDYERVKSFIFEESLMKMVTLLILVVVLMVFFASWMY